MHAATCCSAGIPTVARSIEMWGIPLVLVKRNPAEQLNHLLKRLLPFAKSEKRRARVGEVSHKLGLLYVVYSMSGIKTKVPNVMMNDVGNL